MKYYILNGKIEVKEKLPNPAFYEFQELSSEQVAFYLANPTATLSEVNAMQMTVRVPTLDELKQAKLNELQTSAQQAEAAGYTDSDFNVTIRIAEKDLLAWNNRLTLIREAEALQIPVGDQKFTDINDKVHTLSLLNFRILMVKMGVYADGLWVNLAEKSDAANACETSEELDLIQW